MGLVSIEMALSSQLLTEPLSAFMTFREEYLRGMKESIIILRDDIRRRTPVGATRRLLTSISWFMRDLTPVGPWSLPSGPIEIEGKVFSSDQPPTFLGIFKDIQYQACTYARAVEAGTRPHWPPMAELIAWVAYKLRPPVKEIWRKQEPIWTRFDVSRVAFLIGRAISKRGTSPRWMFRNAQADFESQGVLEQKIEAASETALRKVSATTPWWTKIWA